MVVCLVLVHMPNFFFFASQWFALLTIVVQIMLMALLQELVSSIVCLVLVFAQEWSDLIIPMLAFSPVWRNRALSWLMAIINHLVNISFQMFPLQKWQHLCISISQNKLPTPPRKRIYSVVTLLGEGANDSFTMPVTVFSCLCYFLPRYARASSLSISVSVWLLSTTVLSRPACVLRFGLCMFYQST